MKKRKIILGALVALLAFGVAAPSAQAASVWKKTANTTQKASSSTGYKAKVGPSAAPKVTGYTNYSKTISVKNSSGKYVAKGVTSKSLSKGTYKVYSTFKYRKAVAYKATVTKSGFTYLSNLDDASCTLTSLSPNPTNEWFYGGTADCTGTHDGHAASGTVSADWIYFDDEPAPVGTTFASGDDLFDEFVGEDMGESMKWSYKTSVTKHKYVYKASQYRYRYVTVKKVYNPPTASWSEYKAIKVEFWDGIDSLARVRAIIGSNGTRTYFSDSDGQTLTTYKWKTSSGGSVYVSFDDGRAYTKSWYDW